MIARLSNTQFSKIVDLPDLDYLDIYDFDLPWEVFGKSLVNVYVSTSPDRWGPIQKHNTKEDPRIEIF